MTNAELAVLSLVAEEPRHGYQIEQVIEERGMREWTEIGFSSIYYLLKKLEREGLIEGKLEETERGPARKVYHITEQGRRTQHEALLTALSTPAAHRSGLLLALSHLPTVAPDEALAALRRYRRALAEQRERLQAKRDGQQPVPYFVDALFDYTLTMMDAERDWLSGFSKELIAHRDQEGAADEQDGL